MRAWRNALAGLLALVLAGSAGPAGAGLFDAVVGSLFGDRGGGARAGGGCAPARREDLLGGMAAAAALAVTAVTRGAAGVAAALDADGQPAGADRTSGNCLVEQHPFQVQEAVTAANEPTAFDTVPALTVALQTMRETVMVPDGLPWAPEAADAAFQDRYPPAITPTIAAVERNRAEQERLARQSSRAAVRSTAQILTDIDEITVQMTELQAQTRACAGVTCAVAINTQMTALQARVIAALAMMAAATARAQEAPLDYLLGAVARGRANARHDWGDWPGLDLAAPPPAAGSGPWTGF